MGTTTDGMVVLAVKGENEALARLLRRFSEPLAAHLQERIAERWRGQIEVEDVMQVTFLEAFLDVAHIRRRNGQTFYSWLRRLAVNNLHDAIRGLESEKRPHPSRRLRSQRPDASVIAILDLIRSGDTTAPSRAARAEAAGRLDRAIDQLPADYAQVVRCFDLDGMSAREVADLMQRSPGAVYMMRARALRRLKNLLGAEGDFYTDAR